MVEFSYFSLSQLGMFKPRWIFADRHNNITYVLYNIWKQTDTITYFNIQRKYFLLK